MEVDLWPEYDRSGVLVIYRITLTSDTTLPAELTIPIPASTGEPSAVAAKQVDGTLINLTYTKQVNGSWAYIRFTATTPEIQLEYYDVNLTKQGVARHYEYNWPGGNAVAELSIQVQQPLGSGNLQISPNLGTGEPGKDGLNYYTAQVGSLLATQAFKITLDYEKPNDTLSAENLQVQPTKPLTDATPGRIQLFSGPNTAVAVIGLVLIGIVLMAGGGYWYWQSGRSREAPVRHRRQRHESVEEPNSEEEVGEVVYCHRCGNRAGPGDRFCRVCGVPLRTE